METPSYMEELYVWTHLNGERVPFLPEGTRFFKRGVRMFGERTLNAAATKVDLLSQDLVALLEYGERTPKALRNAGRLMKRFVAEDYLEVKRVLTHDISALDLSNRILDWDPRAMPTFLNWEAISYVACTRLDSLPLTTKSVCWATEKARRMMGGLCGKAPSTAVTHDLIVSSMFVTLEASGDRYLRKFVAGWTPPAELLRRGWKIDRIPDAAIDRGGELVLLLEVLGQYGAEKLCEQHRLWKHMRYWLV